MKLAIGGTEMEVWWCNACAQHRTVVLPGTSAAIAPPDALRPPQLTWVEAPDDPRFGRILTEEGG